MPSQHTILIHPPVAKPSEPPAGVARLAGALRAHDVNCTVIDANFEGLMALLEQDCSNTDTWSRRARRHRGNHLTALRSLDTYRNADRYRRAVADLNHLLELTGRDASIRVGLANYVDRQLSPVRSDDLIRSAENPDRNPFYTYYRQQLMRRLIAAAPDVIGLSINFLSQALCAFALIGMLRRELPQVQVIIGGGLITSWERQTGLKQKFGGLVDRVVVGPGEPALLESICQKTTSSFCLPDFQDLIGHDYLSPGWVLPFSASTGCWWRKCSFCPERAERQAFHPIRHSLVTQQLKQLCSKTAPAMIHLLDNALSPALLKKLADEPLGVPWYGFVRIGAPLDNAEFCRKLAESGCVMLKIGLESGDPKVLNALEKGIDLVTASSVLSNLKRAGIATYVYLLFGTPAEDETSAIKTLDYIVTHSDSISFLNLAIFNLPIASQQAAGLQLREFYQGDLALYSDFKHPTGWQRSHVRSFVEKKLKKHPRIQPIVRRDPSVFTSNHAAFFQR